MVVQPRQDGSRPGTSGHSSGLFIDSNRIGHMIRQGYQKGHQIHTGGSVVQQNHQLLSNNHVTQNSFVIDPNDSLYQRGFNEGEYEP
jgi:hypothetical protein